MQFFANTAINDINSSRKLKYLRFTFFICLFVVIVFTLRYNFEYKIHFLNWVLLPSLLALIFSPVVYSRTKNFYLASAFSILPSSLCLLLLVWTAGGLDAPGCIWLTAIPLTLAVLLGVKESVFGFITIGLFIIASYFCKKTGHQINIIKDHSDFEFERMFNFVLFTVYSAVTSILYVNTESTFQKKLKSQKEEIDGLLKILIHDIGTPLSIIGLSLSTVKVEHSPSFENTRNLISRSLENIRILLTQIRTMHSAKDGKATIYLSKVNPSNIINSVCQELHPRFEQKGISLMVDFKHHEAQIMADANILQYVILTNLLTNAIKFSALKGVIEINTKVEEDRFNIEVRDYGIGMPENLLKNISKPYEATNRKGTAGEAGTGYGLPLVFDFVKKLEGRISVESAEIDLPQFKRGSLFKLSFKKAE